jgi:hypothetical protein
VTPAERLAQIVSELQTVGLRCLVMGGHAVRYYGLDRNTNDFDLHLAPEFWDELLLRLARTTLLSGRPAVEGPSWRPGAFRRFQIGVLSDGREEWLEFWRENHLLPPYATLAPRAEHGEYGRRTLAFLALTDLIRSKETERERDWEDVTILEEFLDARLLVRFTSGDLPQNELLARLRSRRGFERLLQLGHFTGRSAVEQALFAAPLSVTQAYLLPFAPEAGDLPGVATPIEPVVQQRLRSVEPGSRMHLALVEVVRRQYKLACQSADRSDKEAIRSAQHRIGP